MIMKTIKRLAAMLLALVLLVGLVPTMELEADAAISTSTFATKVQEFISDSRWKTDTTWSSTQSPKLSTWDSSGCCAYAADFAAYVYGSTSAAWTGSDFTRFDNLNEIRAGDIIYITGHWFVVLERSGNTLRTAEGSFSGKTRVCSDGWGIVNGKIHNLMASSPERTFEYGYHYNFSDSSSSTSYSSSQIYHNIDMSAAVLASRINQQVVNDCAVVAMATVESYLYGTTSTADKDIVYNALIGKNGDNDYAYWGNCGFNDSKAIDWTEVYNQLTKGYPVIVHRGDHWGVVAGYKGSTTTLDIEKFIIVNFYRGTGGTDIAESGKWRNGSTISKMVTRKNGIAITSLSGIKMAINHPAPVHQYGSGHGVYGYVTSNQNLTSVQVKVTNSATGANVFNKTLTPNAKSYLIYNLDSEMTFAKWAKGKYTFTVTAKTASDSRTYQYAFEIASGWPVTENLQSYVFSFNANGGTGAPASQTVYYGGTLHIPVATPTREGYTFLGWHAMRNGDQTWYSAGNGWNTEAQLAAAGYTKRLYPANTDFLINDSWLTGCMDTTGFTFYAQWQKNAVSTYTVSYNANGGSGAPASQTKTEGVALTLSNTIPVRSGYTFLGWATSADGSVAYQSGGSFTADANTTLYAVWQKGCPGTHSYTSQVTAPSCTAQGYTTYTCSLCGDSYKDNETDPLGHSYSEGSCTRCGGKDPNYVEDSTAPQIVVSSVKGRAGDTVTVLVDLKNNPGFSGLNLYVTYSDSLTLVEAVSMVDDLTFTSDKTMVWDGVSDYAGDGTLLKLVFRISDAAEAGKYDVKVHFVEAFTAELDDVVFTTVDGYVEVIDCVYGDANGDGIVNTKDIILIRRHVAAKDPATGVSAIAVEAGADANGDGIINTKDIILVRRHVAAKDPVTGESSVVLGPQ